MPSIKEHIKSSKRRSGREYKEVHEWLDGSGLSYSERLSRHSIMNLRRSTRETGRMFGEMGAWSIYTIWRRITEEKASSGLPCGLPCCGSA